MSLEDRFTARLLAACQECRDFGYSPVRFERMIREHGGVGTAKRLIKSGDLQDGLERLKVEGRLDLSMESIMLEPEFQPLFTQQELDAAQWRLQQL